MSFSTLSLNQDGAILTVTLSNPPINLMSAKMVEELFQLAGRLIGDPEVKVVIFDSADPDFFIAHFDLNDIVALASDPSKAGKYPEINAMQSVALAWQALPQITIAKLDGRCRGAGLEFILGLSMRFASIESKFCSPEAAGGFLASGGGTTRLLHAAGAARAFEFLLSARDFDGSEAERYGIINRALPAVELDDYVENLASQIARRSTPVIAMHKAVLKEVTDPFVETFFAGLAVENEGLRQAINGSELCEGIETMLKMGQRREVELDLPGFMERLGPANLSD